MLPDIIAMDDLLHVHDLGFSQVNSDSNLVCFIKHKVIKQTVKILMRRLIRSRLIWISTVCKCMSEINLISEVT